MVLDLRYSILFFQEDEAEKAEMVVRKRGRKPRRSLVQSEEMGKSMRSCATPDRIRKYCCAFLFTNSNKISFIQFSFLEEKSLSYS